MRVALVNGSGLYSGGDVQDAKRRAMQACRSACGDSIEALYYAKVMIERYELAMREAGFEFHAAPSDNRN